MIKLLHRIQDKNLCGSLRFYPIVSFLVIILYKPYTINYLPILHVVSRQSYLRTQ